MKHAPNYSTVTRLLPHAVPAAYSAVWAKKRDESDTYILFIGEMQQGRKAMEQEAGMEVCVRASTHSKTLYSKFYVITVGAERPVYSCILESLSATSTLR